MYKKKILKKISIPFFILLLLLLASLIYLSDYYHPQTRALNLIDTEEAIIKEDDYIVFMPETPIAGFIFYPGAKVGFESYAPLLNQLAEEDILCIGLQVAGNIAFLDLDAADGLVEQYPEISHWYIGGHSLGGVAAGSYVCRHSGDFEGLVLLASYVTDDLRDTGLSVLSIYGRNDEILNRDQYRKQKANLPPGIREVVIDGGCHAYFGNYGEQDGDGAASITREEQQEITCKAIKQFILTTEQNRDTGHA